MMNTPINLHLNCSYLAAYHVDDVVDGLPHSGGDVITIVARLEGNALLLLILLLQLFSLYFRLPSSE